MQDDGLVISTFHEVRLMIRDSGFRVLDKGLKRRLVIGDKGLGIQD